MVRDGKKVKPKIRFVGWAQDGSLVVTGGEDGTARVFEAATGHERCVIASPHSDAVLVVRISPDNSLLATGCKDKLVRMFRLDADGNSQHLVFFQRVDRAYALAFSPCGNDLAVGSDDNMVCRGQEKEGGGKGCWRGCKGNKKTKPFCCL